VATKVLVMLPIFTRSPVATGLRVAVSATPLVATQLPLPGTQTPTIAPGTSAFFMVVSSAESSCFWTEEGNGLSSLEEGCVRREKTTQADEKARTARTATMIITKVIVPGRSALFQLLSGMFRSPVSTGSQPVSDRIISSRSRVPPASLHMFLTKQYARRRWNHLRMVNSGR